MLTKAQWGHVRRLMGKPRRCSAAFLAQERRSLEEKRKLIRTLRANKPVGSFNYKNMELPREIPAALTIGTNVTAWLHGSPSENMFGLFTGVVEAIDQANGQYRIRFDRKGLGTHNVHDCDVLSNSRVETMPISPMPPIPPSHEKHNFQFSPLFTPGLTPPKLVTGTPGGTSLPRLLNDPHMGAQGVTPIYNSTPIAKQSVPASSTNGTGNTEMLRGFPTDFLRVVAQLTKILSFKRERINRLKELNSEAERLDLIQQPRSAEFQQQYSYVLLDLEALNLHLNQTMPRVTMWCGKLNPNSVDLPMSIPDACNNRASQMVDSFNVSPNGTPRVRSDRAVLLITRLVSLLLQLQEASRGNTVNAYELGCIHESLQELKSNPNIVSASNVGMFENSVEVHIQHIMTGLYQRGSLYQYSMAQAQLQPVPPPAQPHQPPPPPPPPVSQLQALPPQAPPPPPQPHSQQQQQSSQTASQLQQPVFQQTPRTLQVQQTPAAQQQQQQQQQPASIPASAAAIGQQVVSSHLHTISLSALPSMAPTNASSSTRPAEQDMQVQPQAQTTQQAQQQFIPVPAQPGAF
ncbi:protein lin-9 homolog [Sycon ciliatum]